MKILHVIDSGGLYGAEVMLLNLMGEQMKMGLEPVLASIGEPGIAEKPVEAEARRRGLRVEPFRMLPGPNLTGAGEVLRFARRAGVDLLHSHGYKGNILFGLMPAGVRRLPMVATLHGWTWSGGMSRMMLYEWLDRISLRFIDRVVLVNGAMLDHPRLRGWGGLRVMVVDNGIPDEYQEGELPGEEALDPAIVAFCAGGCTIGALGRLSREKGFAHLLEAAAELAKERSDLRVVILGEGGLRGELERQAETLGLAGRLFMPGYVANARRYLPLFKVFALPSLTEGLPMVLLEAMQAGVAVVASAVGGIPGVLDYGRAGGLVSPGSSDDLERGLREALAGDKVMEEKIVTARERVRTVYSSRVMAEKYLAIYRDMAPGLVPGADVCEV